MPFRRACRISRFSIPCSPKNMPPRLRAIGTPKMTAQALPVKTEALSQYELRIVGSSEHREYWIPAGDLTRFNASIVGEIQVVAEFRGRDAQLG
jgi:hypothetical protein